MRPEELSEQLRKGTGKHLEKRRNIVKLSLLALGSMGMGLVSLYQTGIIQHLPEPPLPFFDADKVDASEEAYAVLQTPDAVLALISYAATARFASMGGGDRATKQPWIPLMLAAKLAFDALQAGGALSRSGCQASPHPLLLVSAGCRSYHCLGASGTARSTKCFTPSSVLVKLPNKSPAIGLSACRRV